MYIQWRRVAVAGGICTPADGCAERGCENFLRHEIYKNYVSSVEAGIGMEEQVIRRTIHVLDVINSVSRSSKCTKIVGGRPHWGSLQRSRTA